MGDYASEDIANASSTSQVIIALTSLNIDILKADDFIKEGNNLLDGLMKYKMDNRYINKHNGISNTQKGNDEATTRLIADFSGSPPDAF